MFPYKHFIPSFITIFTIPCDTVSLMSLHLNITTILQEPFMFELSDLNNCSKKVGVVKDILDLLSERMNFTYELYLSPDGNYGAPDANGVWNGMVGEVLYNRADMAAADLTVTAARSKLLSFSVPYMNADLGFVYKKPTVNFELFAFLMPFSARVWLAICGSLFFTAIILFLFEKLNDKEFSLKSLVACFYFGLACLFAQGPETYPRSIFSRTVAISWWFFSLMTLTLYTATLTSTLTVNRSTLSIKSIEDLLNHENFHYGIELGNTVQSTFEFSEYVPFQIMWQEMMKRRTDSFYKEKDGLAKVRKTNNFAFIRESPYLQYDVTFAPCNLELVISSNSPKTGSGFAFAFSKNSPLATDFSVEILNIFADGRMAAINSKWFKARSQCSENKQIASSVDTIEFEEVRGIFYTFLGGIVVSIFLFLIQTIKQRLLKRSQSKNELTIDSPLSDTISMKSCLSDGNLELSPKEDANDVPLNGGSSEKENGSFSESISKLRNETIDNER